MNQISLATTGFKLETKRTRKRELLDEMNLVIPWSQLPGLIAPHAPAGNSGRPPFAIEMMLHIHLLQQFFGHSDPAMEEALHDIPLYREFAELDAGIPRLLDERTILRFRHMLEQNDSGCRGVEKCQEIQDKHTGVGWDIALMPGKRKALDKTNASHALTDRIEKIKFSIRVNVGHPFRVIKCHFGHRKTRYRGLAKTTSQLLVKFALSNLWMMRKRMIQGLAA